MANLMTMPPAEEIFKREYNNLRGVDFSSNSVNVSTSRSPDALNVYKDYGNDQGQAVETRPGFSVMATATGKIYGIHILGSTALIHHGNKLSKASSAFPDAFTLTEFTGFTLAETFSTSFVFDSVLYMLDGTNYLKYDGATLSKVEDGAFVPTTRIGAKPDGSEGTAHQDVNYMSPYRKNSFVGDGTTKIYQLDATGLDAETPTATVDGTAVTAFTYDAAAGKVTFTTAPAAPATAGTDNVIIQFKKTVSGHLDHIRKCTIAKVFDNRVFFAGNSDYKGVLFHSELKDPSYFTEESQYNDGNDDVPIKAIIQGNGVLVVVKADTGSAAPKVFYHQPSTDETYGRVYAANTTNIATGAITDGVNFQSDVIYVSSLGLEQFYMTATTLSGKHKSRLVDTKFTNEEGFNDIKLEIWDNYLMCLVNGKIYLADWKQRSEDNEYEWYLWDNIGVYDSDVFKPATILRQYEHKLFFGCENGAICKFGGYNDNGLAINAYWTTPLDMFKNLARFKTISKRGGVAQVKPIQNFIIKIAVLTDKERWTDIYERKASGFSFANINFGHIDFGADPEGVMFYKVKRKKIWYFQMKFYCDEINKRFGIYSAAVEATIGSYKKEL